MEPPRPASTTTPGPVCDTIIGGDWEAACE
jgi:hypothetical protein